MRKIISTIQIIALIICFSVVPVSAAETETPSGTPIYTASDLSKLEGSNQSFYLANDIDVSGIGADESTIIFTFEGVLDGNGYSIKNQKCSLFFDIENATVKNINFVDVNIETQRWGVSPIAINSQSSDFENISVSGQISIINNSAEKEIDVTGMVGYAEGGTFLNCTSNVDITVTSVGSVTAIGVARCTKSPNGEKVKMTNCYNKGDIKVVMKNGSTEEIVTAGGVVHSAYDQADLKSCGNSGNIDVKCEGVAYGWAEVYGLAFGANSVSRCYNTGDISLSGKTNTNNAEVSGLCLVVPTIKESYNTGNIKVNAGLTATALVSGIVPQVNGGSISNCYNTGNITVSGKYSANSVAVGITTYTPKITNCYTTGTVKGKAKKIGKFSFIQYGPKNMKGNYYTKGKPYSDGAIGKGINKVSKITKKNCPKLSSKYWTYSKAKGRMILKNNKEK